MPLDYPDILSIRTSPRVLDWGNRDFILYALALGLGNAPMSPERLRYVYERDLLVVPSACTTIARLCYPDYSDIGLNGSRLVLVAQRTEWHSPVPASARLSGEARIREVFDLGPDRGALLAPCVELRDSMSGALIATVEAMILARDEGGRGGVPRDPRLRTASPKRPPDYSLSYQTMPDQALLYRQMGDLNPIHVDPRAAHDAGFAGPILHGLCTYGMICRALLEAVAGWDASRISELEVTFGAPVFPGDRLLFDIWSEGMGEFSIQGRTADGRSVVKHSRARLRESIPSG